MGADETAKRAKGKLKETVGKVIGNEELEAEGKQDQLAAEVKETGENVKEKFEDLGD